MAYVLTPLGTDRRGFVFSAPSNSIQGRDNHAWLHPDGNTISCDCQNALYQPGERCCFRTSVRTATVDRVLMGEPVCWHLKNLVWELLLASAGPLGGESNG